MKKVTHLATQRETEHFSGAVEEARVKMIVDTGCTFNRLLEKELHLDALVALFLLDV